LEESHRGWVLLEFVQRERPGGVDSAVVTQDLPLGEQCGALGAETAQIVGGAEPGLLEVCGGLSGCQGKVSQFGSKVVSEVVGQLRHPPLQQGDGLEPIQDIDFDPAAERSPAGRSGGDQNVSGSAGPVSGDVLRTLGVVEDDQPVRAGSELREQLVHAVGGDAVVRQAESSGEAAELLGDQHWLLCVDPPHDLVVVREAVSVFDGQLSLADSTESVKGPYGRCARGRSEFVWI